MSGFCSIHALEIPFPNLYRKYKWVIYSNNMRKIAESSRTFNQASHAREAAKRFVKCMQGIYFRPGIVRK